MRSQSNFFLLYPLTFNRLVQLSGDESKVDIARSILGSAKIVTVNSESDAHPYVV